MAYYREHVKCPENIPPKKVTIHRLNPTTMLPESFYATLVVGFDFRPYDNALYLSYKPKGKRKSRSCVFPKNQNMFPLFVVEGHSSLMIEDADVYHIDNNNLQMTVKHSKHNACSKNWFELLREKTVGQSVLFTNVD